MVASMSFVTRQRQPHLKGGLSSARSTHGPVFAPACRVSMEAVKFLHKILGVLSKSFITRSIHVELLSILFHSLVNL